MKNLVMLGFGFLALGPLSVWDATGGVAWADEPVHTLKEVMARGFSPADAVLPVAIQAQFKAPVIPWEAHSLAWPAAFQDASHTMGNSMAEFQPFGSPYFHGGCDLRVAPRAQVRTPVAGRIEAGHYDYTNNADGSMTKYFKPWPASGDSTYFEVAVITSDGIRFEFHHMNRDALAPQILDILKRGGGEVAAGAYLGDAIVWPSGDYHHIHYNVIDPNGVRINPEYVSPLILDTQPPRVKETLAVFSDGSVQGFGSGVFQTAPVELVIAVIDQKDKNVYEQPPVLVEIRFDSGERSGWDFTSFLGRSDGSWPGIWNFFKESIRSPRSGVIRTEGGYGKGTSLVRLPWPTGARGAFTVVVGDNAGNETLLSGRL